MKKLILLIKTIPLWWRVFLLERRKKRAFGSARNGLVKLLCTLNEIDEEIIAILKQIAILQEHHRPSKPE